MLTIKYSKAKKKAFLEIGNENGEKRDFGPLEKAFRAEIEDCIDEKAVFVFNGIENFGLSKTSPALVLDVMRKMPLVYSGQFNGLDPEFGGEFTPNDFKDAEELLLAASEVYGTDINELGGILRRSIIKSQEDLVLLSGKLKTATELAIDTETFPIDEKALLKRDIGDTRKSDVRLLSISDGEQVYLVDCVAVGQNLEPLREILETRSLVIHNALFDNPFLLDKYGIWPRGVVFDTMIAARVLSNEAPLKVWPEKYREIVDAIGEELVNPKLEEDEDLEEDDPGDEVQRKDNKIVEFIGDRNRTSNSLDAVYNRFLDFTPELEEGDSNWGRERLSDKQLCYAAFDVDGLIQLKAAILAAADEEDRRIIKLDMAALQLCLDFYREGSLIDAESLEIIYRRRRKALVRIRKVVVHRLPNTDLESNKDTIRALGEAGIYLASLDKNSLKLKRDNPIVRALIVFRRVRAEVIDLQKILRALHPDGKLHARYNPTGAGTGRMSSRCPNLQNIRCAPREKGYINFRELFIVPPGWDMIVADYNQAELRAAAVIANEETMLDIYKSGRADIHFTTASRLAPGFETFNQEEKDEARRKAKAANFGPPFRYERERISNLRT
jgi:DNA polymerase I-like protein with 3'-5' exonuclease and polymerase domains